MDANKLIERMEKETGQRIDSNGGDNNAIAGLIGAMSRMMGQSPPTYTERDDVAAGLLIKHMATPEYENEQRSREMISGLLSGGMSPDDISKLFSA